MNPDDRFAIVAFDSSSESSVVPIQWLKEGGGCLWPSRSSKQYKKSTSLAKRGAPPEADWETYSVRVLSYASMCLHFLAIHLLFT